jgi:mRNA interferase MazF
MELNQYQIVLVNLDPTVGSEINKTRPCVIISPDEMNQFLRTLVIAPITSKSKNYPTRSKIRLNNKDSWVVLDQIRTVDKQRVIKILNHLTAKEIDIIKFIIKEMFVD